MAARTVIGTMNGQANAANFRQWAQLIHDALVFCGLVQTADTGQIDLTAVSAPGAANTSMGYEIWRFNDALQATAPLMLKVEYGSGALAAASSIWLTLSTGTNGAGTPNGKVTPRFQLDEGVGTDTTPRKNHQSGNGSRFVLALWRNPAAAQNIVFGVERTKDVNGADTNEGAFLFLLNPASATKWQLCPLMVGVASAQSYQQGGLTPMNGGDAAGADRGNIGVHVICPASRRGSENPLRQLLGYWLADAAADATFTANIYGIDHTFIALGGAAAAQGAYGIGAYGNAIHTSTMAAMRYD